MFTDAFRRRLEQGANTRWARDLDENHLAGLLWAVGEYGTHESACKLISRQLDAHESEIDPGYKDYRSSPIPLGGDVQHGSPMGVRQLAAETSVR